MKFDNFSRTHHGQKRNVLQKVLNLPQTWTYKRFLIHLSFWIFYVLFFGLLYGKYGKDYTLHLLETSVMLPFVMAATYITIYGILPYYLRTRKLVLSVVFVILLQVIVILGERISLRVLNGMPVTRQALFGVTSIYLMLETNFMVAIAFVVKFYKLWIKEQNEKYTMEKEHLEKELNLLRTQLHPHFLFNTMNNLYALSLEDGSKTSEGIAQISELLRSVLYECNEREIPLEREINIIKNYIELERMRYGDCLKVHFNVEGDTGQLKIAPMILFTFVENCFKHGCSQDASNPFVDVKINVNNGSMLFEAENSKPNNVTETEESKYGGVGLNNVKKRLGILYPGRFVLNFGSTDCCYKVSLKLMQ